MGHTKASSIHQAVMPRSTFYDSPFGRLFGKLPPWESPESVDSDAESALRDFATNSMSEVSDEPALPFDVPENGTDWVVADLLKAAGMPASAEDVENFINSGHV